MVKHYRVKQDVSIFPHVETVGDMVKLALDENTHGWYHESQVEPCEPSPPAPKAPDGPMIEAP